MIQYIATDNDHSRVQNVVKYGMPASAIPYQATIQLIFGFIGFCLVAGHIG